MSDETLPREDCVCLPPDAYNIGLLRDGGMPGCPCCQGTATTFSRFFPHSGIYQAYVHCAHCDVQVFKNAYDHEEGRRLAADTWSKRPVHRLATAPDSEKLREAAKRVQRRVVEWDALGEFASGGKFAAMGEQLRHDAMTLVTAALGATL